ncbi:hypothetical protein CEUSTIGMA_g3975.t1 [Chlamydomonas eustigma]|uniref:Major facilitator superfamily (MFS) profile domain-containing protein n=1 Tax=Chlamydomonas eustigma TaxID=1157962 RepID=A0A250X0S5_9CHLO|nr:hypothetical protein CEUSTIGMA_g3975.t1 [Chlamydomonas eustigma]|eukprot:GAX76529.1 hypothetical protein CEUSTIGMA_g3975.t1 [Chlamydomonas eustigma]
MPPLNEAYPFRLRLSVGAALLGSFQSGYQIAVLNTALEHVTRSGSYYSGSVLASPILFGAVLGALSAGWVSNKYGPKSAQLITAFYFLLGTILTALPWGDQDHNQHGFVIGRCISGLGVGAASIHASRYIRDICPRELRPSILRMPTVLQSTGVLIAYMIGLPYWYLVDSVGVFGLVIPWWRVMVAGAALFAVAQVLCLLACPESPSWLESRDKEKADEACILLWGSRAILYEEAGDQQPETPPDDDQMPWKQASLLSSAEMHWGHHATVDNSLERRQNATLPQGLMEHHGASISGGEGPSAPLLSGELSTHSCVVHEGWFTTLMRYEYRRLLMLGLGLPVLQQASGISAVLLYSAEIFPELGFDHATIWGCVILGLVNLSVTSVAALISDRFGRRPVMIVSYAGMTACLFAISIITFFQDLDGPSQFAPPGSPSSPPSPPPPPPPSGSSFEFQDDVEALDIANAILLCFYTAFYALAAGPLSRLYLDEILPLKIKAHVSSLGVILGWTCSLLVAVSFLPALEGIGIGGIFMIFGVFSVLALTLVLMMMVESKGKSSSELDQLLILPPRPQLRNFFPGYTVQGASSAASEHSLPSIRVSYSGLTGIGSKRAQGQGLNLGTSSTATANDAWTKLLLMQRQQQQWQHPQHVHDQSEEAMSSSF